MKWNLKNIKNKLLTSPSNWCIIISENSVIGGIKMITDLTIEIFALKCNSQDLFNAKLVASKNQMISGYKKHTTRFT